MVELEQFTAWFRKIQLISQYGLTYSKDPFDRERFEQLGELATEMAAHLTGAPLAQVARTLALETGPPTPKLDVRAAVFDGDRVLLVKELDGLWALPGGWIDLGESPARAAEREVKEESGYDCKATKLVAVLDRDKHAHPPMLLSVYKLMFLCELTGGAAQTSIETSAVDFFPVNALPPLSVARVLEAQIALAFEHRRDPSLATVFD